MLVDVSHTVEHGMKTYRGLPAPLVCDFLSREQSRSHYAPGTEFHIGKVEMVVAVGAAAAHELGIALKRIEHCLGQPSDEQVRWRPRPRAPGFSTRQVGAKDVRPPAQALERPWA